MYNALNKSITATETAAAAAPTNKAMPAKLSKVSDAVKKIVVNSPKEQRNYTESLEKAKTSLDKIMKAKESVETEEELDAALDEERRCRGRVRFFEKKLDEIRYSPRIPEDEYNAHVSAVKSVVEKAANEYRKAAEKLADELVAVRKKYLDTAREADRILTDLDSAANVLQSKHRYKEFTFVGRDPIYKEDPYEWRNHALRYMDNEVYGTNNTSAYTLATQANGTNSPKLQQIWLMADRVSRF